MRVAVVGTSGSGKSTFAAALAKARVVPFIELDLINWRPGWQDRSRLEPEAFKADVAAALAQPAWVLAGNYSLVRDAVWAAATHVVWLDLPRPLVMAQVIRRSFQRAASGADVFPGCKEKWGRMFDPEHPIPWAWSTYHRRKAFYAARMADPAFTHVTGFRITSRAEAKACLANFETMP
jgi:adenylate kinase family enzyme